MFILARSTTEDKKRKDDSTVKLHVFERHKIVRVGECEYNPLKIYMQCWKWKILMIDRILNKIELEKKAIDQFKAMQLHLFAVRFVAVFVYRRT